MINNYFQRLVKIYKMNVDSLLTTILMLTLLLKDIIYLIV